MIFKLASALNIGHMLGPEPLALPVGIHHDRAWPMSRSSTSESCLIVTSLLLNANVTPSEPSNDPKFATLAP
jgi:hypothetical protein